MNCNAFCFGGKNGFKSIFVQVCCLSVTWESIIFTAIKTTNIYYNQFVFIFLKAGTPYESQQF